MRARVSILLPFGNICLLTRKFHYDIYRGTCGSTTKWAIGLASEPFPPIVQKRVWQCQTRQDQGIKNGSHDAIEMQAFLVLSRNQEEIKI